MIFPRIRRALGARAAVVAVVAASPAVVAIAVSGHGPSPSPSPEFPKARFVQAGVAVELSVSPAGLMADGSAPERLQEGQTVNVRFALTDAVTGAPYTKAYPAAWIDPRASGEGSDEAACTAKLQRLVSGGLNDTKEAVDLNIYHVAVLGADGAIYVVDPRFNFGGSSLLTRVPLRSHGADWAITGDQGRMFVSMPDADKIAAIDTQTFRVIAEVDAGPRPKRALLQPDEGYLWTASDEKVPEGAATLTAISPADLQVAARIPVGAGSHDIAFSDDNRVAFVTNGAAGTVSIVDVRELSVITSLKTGRAPGRVAYSRLALAAYVTDPVDGTITAIDAARRRVVATIPTESGVGAIAFEPQGRYAFVVNPEQDDISIVDSVSNQIVQSGKVEKGPDQVAFSDTIAYIRHRGTATVLMAPLGAVGTPGKPISVVDFGGGEAAPGAATYAANIVCAPGGEAVLVANAADKAIYYYKEGSAAPMGHFSSYGGAPESVMVVDRSLRERSPGVYETTVRLPRAGLSDVAFVVGSPRVKHCFPLEIAGDPAKVEPVRIAVESLVPGKILPARHTTRLRFRLKNAATSEPAVGLSDVSVIVYTSGNWHMRSVAAAEREDVYAVDFAPPTPGSYYVAVESRSLGLQANMQHPMVFDVVEGDGGPP